MTISENQILRADDLYHVYDTEAVDGNIVALRGIYIEVKRGEVVSVVGPSGSGKSTSVSYTHLTLPTICSV